MSELREYARWLSKELSSGRDAVKALSAPQLGNSSIESGKVEEYDDAGTLVSVTGEQFDGTHVSATLAGPVPPEPTPPTITIGPGQVEVRWNGLFANGELSPMDFSHVAVHASREDIFGPDNTTQHATITGESGDSATVMLDPGSWSVLLVAVSKAGKWSDPSDPVPVEVTDNVISDLQDAVATFDDSLAGLQTSVNGKNTITNSTADAAPSAPGATAGDRWQKWSTLATGGKLLASWRWDGTQWIAEAMDPTYLPLVDIGAGTFGSLDGGRLVAQSVKAAQLQATLILASDIVAGNPASNHARMTPTGFKVFAPAAGGGTSTVVSLGSNDSVNGDYLQVIGPDGVQKAGINASGAITAQDLDVANDIVISGDSLATKLDRLPKGIITWKQFTGVTWPTLGSAGGEVGLFEIGWPTPETTPRMYAVNVPPILIKSLSGSTGRHGLVMRITTDGTPPSIPGSQIVARDYISGVPAGDYATARFNNVLVSSNNGPYIRVMVSLIATVGSSIDGTLVEVSVDDKGYQVPTGGSLTTGGVTGANGVNVAPPPSPVVTKSITYNHTSVKSFSGDNTAYGLDTTKGYQGLSPTNGNMKSLWNFPDLTGVLTNATVNKIEAFFYFDYWSFNNSGTAQIVVHGNTTQPATYSDLGPTPSIASHDWPQGAGRWVEMPSTLYAGFKTGTYRGFGLRGDPLDTTYGIANAAKIRVTYTK